MEKQRPLTETEIRIIERDAGEQRSLSAELNGRASLIAALIAIAATLATLVDIPEMQFIVLGSLLLSLGLFWRISRGEKYKYPKMTREWVQWMDKEWRDDSKTLAQQETDLAQGYYRALMDAALSARNANQRKSKLLETAGPLSVGTIIVILAWDLLARVL